MKSLSCVRLLATPRTAAYQAPPSMGFSRQEYWSGVPLPSPSFLVGTIYSLSLCIIPISGYHLHSFPLLCSRVPVSPSGKLLYNSGIPVSMSGAPVFAAATQRMLPDHLALVAKEVCVFCVPWDCSNERESSWQVNTPRALCRQLAKPHFSLSVKETYLS